MSWLGGGVRKRMVMESEGWWLSMSLPSSTIETRCPLPKAEYRTMESFMVMMIQEKVFFFFLFFLALAVVILRRVNWCGGKVFCMVYLLATLGGAGYVRVLDYMSAGIFHLEKCFVGSHYYVEERERKKKRKKLYKKYLINTHNIIKHWRENKKI